MNLFLRKILLACTCFFVSEYTNAQVNFTTTTFPSIINKDDSFNYRIIFANADTVGPLSKPDLHNFIILSGPKRLDELKKLDGKLMRYAILEYHLKPKIAGNYIIDPLFATINYKKYKSNAVSIIVNDPTVGEASRPDISDYIFHKGENLADKIKKNMVLRLEVDKKSCYVGEPIIAKIKLYARLKNRSTENYKSSFNGFSVTDIISPDSTPQTRGKLNNREYNISTMRMAQLYPLQAGLINLESAQLETVLTFVKEAYAQFKDSLVVYDDFVNARLQPGDEIEQTATLKSEPIDINVKPLPEKNKPASFKGSVGSFQIIAGLQKPLLSTDETGRLSVTIIGSGNMLLLTAPDINWPNGIESFDPKFSENIAGTTVPISGSKKFEYSFSVNDSGHFIIPAINFSFFDPVSEDYKTVSTDPIAFQVSKADGKPMDLSHFNIVNNKPSFLNSIFNHRSWIIIFIAVVMFSGLFMWVINDKQSAKTKLLPVVKEEDAAMIRIVEASAVNQQNVFSKTETCMNQDDCFGFYTLLNTELKNYLVHKFSFDPNAINSNTIETLMDKKGIANDIALKLFRLMQQIEWQLYTPFERNEKMNELYSEAHEIVQLINTATTTHL